MATIRTSPTNLKKAVFLYNPETMELVLYDFLNLEFENGAIFKFGQLLQKDFKGIYEELNVIPSVFSSPNNRFISQPFLKKTEKSKGVCVFDTIDYLQYHLDFEFEEEDIQILAVKEDNDSELKNNITGFEVIYAVLLKEGDESNSKDKRNPQLDVQYSRNKMGALIKKSGPFIIDGKKKDNETMYYLEIKKCHFELNDDNNLPLKQKSSELLISKKYIKSTLKKKTLPMNISHLTNNHFYTDISIPEILSKDETLSPKNIANDFLAVTSIESDHLVYRRETHNSGMEVMDFKGNYIEGITHNDGKFLVSDVTYCAFNNDFEDHQIRNGYSPFEKGLCIIDLLKYQAYYLKSKKGIKILKIWRQGEIEHPEAYLAIDKDEKAEPGKDDQKIKLMFIRESSPEFVYFGTLKKNLKVNTESYKFESQSQSEMEEYDINNDDLNEGDSNYSDSKLDKLTKHQSEPIDIHFDDSLEYNDGDIITDITRIEDHRVNKDSHFLCFDQVILVLNNDKIKNLMEKNDIIPSFLNTYYEAIRYFGNDFQKNLTLPKINNSIKLMCSLLKGFERNDYRLKLLKRAIEEFKNEENEEAINCCYLYFPEYENINTNEEEIL